MKSLSKKIAPFLITLVVCFSGYSRKDPDYTIGFVAFISIFGMGLSVGMIIKSAIEHFKNKNQ
jgi:hypothetical protein